MLLCFDRLSNRVAFGQFSELGALAGGLNVVQPLAVVAHAAAGARLHEF